jgi:hypothetical protein
MAFSFPLALNVLADRLIIESVTWDISRNDELSGTGDGRVWQAELAPTLWRADVALSFGRHATIKQVAALVRKLHGAQEDFWLYDPLSKYPQSDPTGSILGASTVQVHSIGAGNKSLRLKGLPAAYQLTLADKFQIAYASSKNFFGEISESVTADGSGVTPEFEIFPHVPSGLAVNDAVTLSKPACRMFIMPGSFSPGKAAKTLTDGAGFKAMERRR